MLWGYRFCTWRTTLSWITCGLLVIVNVAACSEVTRSEDGRAPVIPAVEMPANPAVPPTTGPAPVRDSGWQPLFPGAEVRTHVAGRAMTALRVVPTAIHFDVGYTTRPEEVRTIDSWLEGSTALAAVNCGFYFTDEQQQNHAIGLLAGPQGTLSPLRSQWGGVLFVNEEKGWVQTAPPALKGPVRLGVQGWPMLVRNGAVVPRLDADNPDARTVVAQDDQGRVIFLVDTGGVSLASLAQFLVDSDLGIVQAVNLDGGSSTGLRFRSESGAAASGYDSFWIPCALLMSPR